MEWEIVAWSWLVHAAASGLMVLGLGSVAVRVFLQPVVRCRLAVWSILGAMSVPWLGLISIIPQWSVAPTPARPAEPGAIALPLHAIGPVAPRQAAVPAPPRQPMAEEETGDP